MSPLKGLAFCLWCRDRAAIEFGETVWDGLSPEDRTRVDSLLEELKGSLTQGRLIAPDRAAALQAEVMALGPEGGAVQGVHSDAVEMRSLIWQTLEFCRTTNPQALCAVSETMVNSWDLRLGDEEDYSNNNMFTFPTMHRELELQEEYLGRKN